MCVCATSLICVCLRAFFMSGSGCPTQGRKNSYIHTLLLMLVNLGPRNTGQNANINTPENKGVFGARCQWVILAPFRVLLTLSGFFSPPGPSNSQKAGFWNPCVCFCRCMLKTVCFCVCYLQKQGGFPCVHGYTQTSSP